MFPVKQTMTALCACLSLFLAACGSSDGGAPPPASPAASTTTEAPLALADFGEEVEAPGVTLTVDAVTESEQLTLHADGVKRGTSPEETISARTGGKFVTVHTTVENTGNQPWDLTCSFAVQVALFNKKGQRFKEVDDLYRIPGNPDCSETLNPGFSTRMAWPFEIPVDVTAERFGFADPETHYDEFTFINLVGAPTETAQEPPAVNASPANAPVQPRQESTPQLDMDALLDDLLSEIPRNINFFTCQRDGGGNHTGRAELGDGRFESHPECEARRAEERAARPYQCPETDLYVADLAHCSMQFRPPASQPAPVADGAEYNY